jgi:hypothetical protein
MAAVRRRHLDFLLGQLHTVNVDSADEPQGGPPVHVGTVGYIGGRQSADNFRSPPSRLAKMTMG